MPNTLLIQYPSGGFGHFLYYIVANCFPGFHTDKTPLSFSGIGDSHLITLNSKTWELGVTDFSFVPLVESNSDTRYITLIDRGMFVDDIESLRVVFPENQIIRCCIDPFAKSIINQTCLFKAERKEQFDFYSQESWEQREQITKQYHYFDSNADCYINNYQPILNDTSVLNLSISDFCLNFDNVISRLSSFLMLPCDTVLAKRLYKDFFIANEKYFFSLLVWLKLQDSLDNNYNIDLSDCTSIHDQGFINYNLEKKFNLVEIPPWDFKDWFKNTDEIVKAVEKLKNEK